MVIFNLRFLSYATSRSAMMREASAINLHLHGHHHEYWHVFPPVMGQNALKSGAKMYLSFLQLLPLCILDIITQK